MEGLSAWLASTALSEAFASATWFVPAVQTVHILAIAAVVTMTFMMDSRLLRLVKGGPYMAYPSRSFWTALLVLLITGALMVIAEPERELLNWMFQLKMLLVAVLAAMTWSLRSMWRKDAGYWTASSKRRLMASMIGCSHLLLCIGVVAAGRFIAYV